MHNVVLQITKKLVDRLPANQNYLSPDELDKFGIPDFVLKRIRIELENNMLGSLDITKTDWVDMNSPEAKTAWKDFVDVIIDKTRLPMSYASSVFENCLDDIISILSEPRKNIPRLIFDQETELNAEQIQKRSEIIVVYDYLAQALIRYMNKKGLETLSKDKAARIITQLDIRLTENLGPLNWAQTLDPLFELTDDAVDSELLRRFFEEKGKTVWADRFDKETQLVTKARIINILTRPENEEISSSSSHIEDEPEVLERESEKMESLSDSIPEFTESPHVEEKANEIEEFTDTQRKTDDVLSDDHVSSQRNDTAGISAENQKETSKKEEEHSELLENKKNESVLGTSVDEDEIPIWKRFISDKKKDESLLKKFDRNNLMAGDNDSGKTLADKLAESQSDKTINNTSGAKHKVDNYTRRKDQFIFLYNTVKDQEILFIKRLFRGDQEDFMEAIDLISQCQTWQEASKYISTEIFRKNMINIYSEIAIDFTDRLQSYFLEKSKN